MPEKSHATTTAWFHRRRHGERGAGADILRARRRGLVRAGGGRARFLCAERYLDAGFGDIPGMRAELWVHQNDVRRAQEILSRHAPTTREEDDEEETES